MLVVAKDNKFIVSGSYDYSVKILDIHDNTVVSKYYHRAAVNHVAFTSDNQYNVSAAFDFTILIWNYLERKLERLLEGHNFTIRSIKLHGMIDIL